MSMITYEQFLGGIRVRLDGKSVGAIKTVRDGFQYQPNGSKNVGEVFPTIEGVKASLEGDN